MYTLDYSLSQLDRMQDMIDSGHCIQIIHTRLNDQQPYEDRYVVLVDCEPEIYTLLCLL